MVHETQQCPVCAEEIRAKALRCQFCGEVLAPRRYKEARRKLDKAQPQRATRPRRGRTLLRSPLSWIVLAGIVVVAVVLIVWLRGLSETPAKLMGLWQGMSCAQVAERRRRRQ